MKEIVVISGKGGTGKTSFAAALSNIAHMSTNGKCVTVDCDVDAADLHLILKPVIKITHSFVSGKKAEIRSNSCVSCGVCMEYCRFGAIKLNNSSEDIPTYMIEQLSCEGCGVCVNICPSAAIDFTEQQCGEWYISESRFGHFIHAKLNIAAENSGRLVTILRKEARKIARNINAEYIIVDGSPGIGCPVIASLTASNFALIVTEPTISGEHDFKRIAELTKKLSVPAAVCVNKWDINKKKADEIKKYAQSRGIVFLGYVSYSKTFVDSQSEGKTVVEFGSNCETQNILNTLLNTCL